MKNVVRMLTGLLPGCDTWKRCPSGLRMWMLTGALSGALCASTMGAGSVLPDEQAEMPLVNNVFYDTDLQQALADISAQTGVTIVCDPSVWGLVTAELIDVPLDEALELLLAGMGLHIKREPRYYLIFSADEKSDLFPFVAETRVVRLVHAKAAAARSLLPTGLRKFVEVDGDTDTLSVTAPPRLMERILADLARMDVARKHVMLDVRVVVLDTSGMLDLGVDWTFPSIRAGTFVDDVTQPSWPWGLRIGYTPGREFTNSLLLTLNLMTQNDEATIVASPQVLGQDGKKAKVAVTTEEYFEILTEGFYARSQLEKIQTGTILSITPRIGAGGEITLVLEVEVSDVVARGRSDLPVVSRRIAESTVQVESGGTAAIAGLMDSRTQSRIRSVPGAGDVPVVGHLFRSNSVQQGTQQVAVFVTATLVEQGERAFEEGRLDRPIVGMVDPEQFRAELGVALERLNSGS